MPNKIKDVNIHKIKYKRNKKTKYELNNKIEFYNKYKMLKMLAISVFEWKGLPRSIDKMYFEKTLFERSFMVLFKEEDFVDIVESDESGVFLTLPVTLSHNLNVYGIPKSRRAYAVNGYQKVLDEKNSVIIYDNMLKMSMDDIIYTYAERLSKVERIIDVNLNHTRHPFVIKTTEKARGEIQEILTDIENNKPLILVDDMNYDVLTKGTEVFNLNAPFIVDKLMDYKKSLENEILTIIGIGNSSQDKRERLLASEMENVADLNSAYATVRLRARKIALEEMKEMFPKVFDNVTVSYSTDIDNDEFVKKVREENGEKDNNSSNDS